ncbi:sugar transporter [Paenibacillus sp. J31TS4]|uniref:BglG family transcription antiterminator n=1 Tax=Paenibacillus sp. J31TS4 TaxID=2807195 RepID=UPI001B27CF1C|nr:BglG family transcription antiterminator [Paenibacillus sp. J31TS4]GIP39924.1 sugar transporter [Paenibacillus sp. J31TS4]
MDERSMQILTLLQEADGYVPASVMMDKFHISKRTVYYDLDKINHWLITNGLDPVEHLRGSGFRLPKEAKDRLPKLVQSLTVRQYYYSPEERKAWLAIHLLTQKEPLFKRDLAELLQVSRGTAHQDLAAVRETFTRYGVGISFDRVLGYRPTGREEDKRRALTEALSPILSDVSWKEFVSQVSGLVNASLTRTQLPQLKEEDLASVYGMIDRCEAALGIELTDEMVVHLASRLLLFASRIATGETVKLDRDEAEALRRTPEYRAAEDLASQLGALLGIRLPGDEIGYLTIQLLGARLNRASSLPDESGTDERIRELTAEMIDRFERQACVYFHDREQLESNLQVHMKPAYYRLKYGIRLPNPAVDSIRDRYGEIFVLTKAAVKPFEDYLEQTMPDDEIGYVAMHFGGWMKREQAVPAGRRKAAIVCVNGVSTARMLKAQLEQLFPSLDILEFLSLRDYERYEGDADVIFSTVPLQGGSRKIFKVSPILSDLEKADLLAAMSGIAGGPGRGGVGSAETQALQLLKLIRRHADIRDEEALGGELTRFLATGMAGVDAGEKPVLRELLTEATVRVRPSCRNWREAIRQAAEPLAANGSITPSYIEAMLGKVETYGPYMVVAPGVAIAHAKPEEGVNRLGMSLLKLEEPVAFSEEEKHQVRAIVVLAAQDGERHLRALQDLTRLLREEEARTRLLEASTVSELLTLFDTNIPQD